MQKKLRCLMNQNKAIGAMPQCPKGKSSERPHYFLIQVSKEKKITREGRQSNRLLFFLCTDKVEELFFPSSLTKCYPQHLISPSSPRLHPHENRNMRLQAGHLHFRPLRIEPTQAKQQSAISNRQSRHRTRDSCAMSTQRKPNVGKAKEKRR